MFCRINSTLAVFLVAFDTFQMFAGKHPRLKQCLTVNIV